MPCAVHDACASILIWNKSWHDARHFPVDIGEFFSLCPSYLVASQYPIFCQEFLLLILLTP